MTSPVVFTLPSAAAFAEATVSQHRAARRAGNVGGRGLGLVRRTGAVALSVSIGRRHRAALLGAAARLSSGVTEALLKQVVRQAALSQLDGLVRCDQAANPPGVYYGAAISYGT